MLSLEQDKSDELDENAEKTLYDEILDSGLKVVEDDEVQDTHRYTVELGYRSEDSELKFGNVTFIDSEKGKDSGVLARGDQNALDTVLGRLNGEFELEYRKGSQYVTY